METSFPSRGSSGVYPLAGLVTGSLRLLRYHSGVSKLITHSLRRRSLRRELAPEAFGTFMERIKATRTRLGARYTNATML
jgi:hypothetical protein